MTVRQKIGLVSTTGTLRLSTCPLYSHQHPFSSILWTCMGCTAFLINISPYFCSASFLFPHVTASNFQRVCREYGSTLSAVGIFSWAVDEMIEMTCMLPDVTMHKSSSVGSQLQWFSNGTGPHQCEWSLSHIILGWIIHSHSLLSHTELNTQILVL